MEEEELATFEALVKGRKVLFYDVGGNAGIFSLVVAKAAKPTSKIIAFEPNPEMQRRFARNVALNKFSNITMRPIALGDIEGDAFLSIVKAGNLGQASLRDGAEGEGHRVPIKRLPDEMKDPAGFDLTLMKVDVEGHEPGVLAPLLAEGRKKGHWPDIIMLEHTSAERLGCGPDRRAEGERLHRTPSHQREHIPQTRKNQRLGPMDKFTTLTGVAAPMPLVNIDTDMIIPKQFLKTIQRSGLGKNLFDEMRYTQDGKEIADFVLNQPATAARKSLSRATTSAAARRANTRPGRCWISASAA